MYTDNMLQDLLPLTCKLLQKTVKIQMARQYPRFRGPEECMDVKRNTLLKLAELIYTGHVIRMPGERLSTKVIYGDLQEDKRFQDGKKIRNKDTLKASQEDFNISTESW